MSALAKIAERLRKALDNVDADHPFDVAEAELACRRIEERAHMEAEGLAE